MDQCLWKNSSSQVFLGIETVWEKVIFWQNCLEKHKKDETNEQAYFAYKNAYKAKCCKCSKYGHRHGDPRCSELNPGTQGPEVTSSKQDTRNFDEDTNYSPGKCSYYGETGHKKKNCKKKLH